MPHFQYVNWLELKLYQFIDIDDFFVDLFYYFDKSCKWKKDFREFQEFTELKILKHCKTRWRSLENAVQCVLWQWDALFAYLLAQINAVFRSSLLMLTSLKSEVNMYWFWKIY